jgi:hypothetical protein
METTTLPFDGKFQSGLLYLLITDYEFLRNSIEDLSQKHFDAGETHIKLFKLIKLVYEKTKKPLSLSIIKNSILQLQLRGTYSEGDTFGMTNILDAGKLMTPSEYEFIRENCYNFLKKQTMALAYAESLAYYEKGDYDELYSIIGKAYKKSFGIENSLGIDYLNDSVHDRYSEPPRTGIWSTGFERLDSFIDGGMAKKECYTILAPTGRGKTALLCNFAVSAIKQKLKTLFITLEMSERQICQRFDAIISGFSPSELASLPEARVELQRRISEELHGSMPFVKGFDRGKLTVAGLKTYLERFSMENGTPEVVILDWFGCLKLPTNTDKKHEALAEVADEIINMSREFNCSILGAHQTNRGAVGSDVFGYDKVSESFSSLFGMDAVFALGASDKAKDAGKRTLSIAKNRMGPDSVYVNLMGNKPSEPLTFKFTEVPSEEEEASLLYPDSESDKNSD